MTEEEQIDIIIDILTDFDEMGFVPTTTVPDPETYAIKWRNKLTDALKDYRNRQKAEIDRQDKEIERLNGILENYAFEYGTTVDKERFLKKARDEAAKEFAKRLKSKHRRILDYDEAGFSAPTDVVYVETIDNLVKEFTEEKT
jgi:hypothetical protein